LERLEDASPLATGEVQVPDGPVLEEDPEPMGSKDRHAGNWNKIGHRAILSQRFDRDERLVSTSSLPICEEFVAVKSDPVLEQV
jgi:hypothetical protein